MLFRTSFRLSMLFMLLILVSCQQQSQSWVKSTTPGDEAQNVPSKTPIMISFNRQMDESSLNSTNIQVLSGKYADRNVSEIFHYKYDKGRKTLYMMFSDPHGGWGSEDAMKIIVSKEVENASHQKMDSDYVFGFRTK
jgi:hypothetical protein